MADIAFTKPTNANNGPPEISAANLQARDDALDAVVHKANRGAALLRADLLNEATDVLQGQPPAARAHQGTNTLPGYADSFAGLVDATVVLPAGGTFIVRNVSVGSTFNCSSPSLTGQVVNVCNGGATITIKTATGRITYDRLT